MTQGMGTIIAAASLRPTRVQPPHYVHGRMSLKSVLPITFKLFFIDFNLFFNQEGDSQTLMFSSTIPQYRFAKFSSSTWILIFFVLFSTRKLVTEGEKVVIGGEHYKVYCRKHYRKITGLI